jgi:sec-independent protein translocase protein TatA
MLANLTGWHFLILLAVVLLIFGAAKLPALARSMGQSARVFKGEMRALKEDEVAAEGPVPTPPREGLRADGGQSTDGLRSS